MLENYFSDNELSATPDNIVAPGLNEMRTWLVADANADRTLEQGYDLLNNVIEIRQPEVYNFDSSAEIDQQYYSAQPTVKNEYDAYGNLI
ncbi:MAG: hypothetical protein GWO08_11625, partial [Gammaproteobacteria bacterium]|nr:hypothetical protein [Gammaproteobacteria bacterium]